MVIFFSLNFVYTVTHKH